MPKQKPSTNPKATVTSQPEGISPEAAVPAAMPTEGANAVPQAATSGQRTGSVPEAISASLLRVGISLEECGMTHQALTPYLKLMERYPNSQESPMAVGKVLAIAEGLRQRGQPHAAMTVLDRLEAAYPGH